MGSSTPPRRAYAALLALALAGCAEPLVTATVDASSEAADDDLPKVPVAPTPPVRRDVPRAEEAEPDADAPDVADADDDATLDASAPEDVAPDVALVPPDVAPDAAPTPPDVTPASPDAAPRDAPVDAAPDAGIPIACGPADASTDAIADASLPSGPDVAPGACTNDGQVAWYNRTNAPDARCVMCVCGRGRFQCAERVPDGAPLVTPTVATGSTPAIPLTWRMLGDGVYELTALRWLGGCPHEAPRPLREVVEVRHGYASHTFLAFARRVDGGPVERSLDFAREYEGGPFSISEWCPASGAPRAGVLLRFEGTYPNEGFTLYQPENADGTGPVLARTFRRVE